MKKIIAILLFLLILGTGAFFFLSSKQGIERQEQAVLNLTLKTSTQYLALRYRTDNVLTHAQNFDSSDKWKQEIADIISDWQTLENQARDLETKANTLPVQEVSINLIKPVSAYDRNEISNIFDSAPAGKKIATLAKYLGVDAKRAQMILNQDQDQVTADAWNDAGDTFQKLETSAVTIKDGCKIAGFVGTTALTGGSSTIFSGSTLSQVSLIVSGADLTLEIVDDGAKIALGNHNKISTLASDTRKATEPLSGILTITTLPGNLSKGIEKLNALSFTAEQLNSTAQEGKIIGIEIPALTIDQNQKFTNIKKYKSSVYISKIDPGEVDKWLSDTNLPSDPETTQTIEAALKLGNPSPTAENNPADSSNNKNLSDNPSLDLSGTSWRGVLTNKYGQDLLKTRTNDFEITLNQDGSCTTKTSSYTWKQSGNMLMLYGQNESAGYHVFELSGNSLIFRKIVYDGHDVPAGSEFMNATAPEGTLYKL